MMIKVGANHQYSMQVSVWEGPELELCNILLAFQVAFLVLNHLLDLIPFFLLVE